VSLDALLLVVSERQGSLVGSGSEAERRVFLVNHEISSPRMPGTGLSTGRRHHKPLVLRRDVSPASLGLRRAFATNEWLMEVRLQCYQPTSLGVPQHRYTIQLFNASICSMRLVLPYTRSTKSRVEALQEEIGFAYLRIEWTWHQPPMSASDDWLIAR
jgi:type VI secretion system secreted protein Hcp